MQCFRFVSKKIPKSYRFAKHRTCLQIFKAALCELPAIDLFLRCGCGGGYFFSYTVSDLLNFKCDTIHSPTAGKWNDYSHLSDSDGFQKWNKTDHQM